VLERLPDEIRRFLAWTGATPPEPVNVSVTEEVDSAIEADEDTEVLTPSAAQRPLRFRRGVRLDPSQVSDLRGRRGMGLPGGAIPVGGGATGIIILLLYLFLSGGSGLSPGLENLDEAPPSDIAAECRTGEDANMREDCRIVGSSSRPTATQASGPRTRTRPATPRTSPRPTSRKASTPPPRSATTASRSERKAK
jgi:hypothetical protein